MAKRLAMTGAASGTPSETVADPALPGPIASLGLRSLAFILDSIVLFAFGLVFLAVALLIVFFGSDQGRAATPPESAVWAAIGVGMLVVPAWLALNLLIGLRQAQSVGHYVLGLQIVREDGGPIEPGRHLLRLLGLNPVIFHPLLAGGWALLAAMAGLVAGSAEFLVVFLALVPVCVLAPLIAFAAAAFDHGRRGLHDRIAGTVVVRLG
jgi:uncharacterized RDD family membrane protein YckC